MIQFLSVRLQNFLSHSSTEISLTGTGHPVLVTGRNTDSTCAESNGSGKSALFEAVAWGLYGSTLRGLTSKDVTRKGLGKCRVDVVLDVFEEGAERDGIYTIIRHQKDGSAGNSLQLLKDAGMPGPVLPYDISGKDKKDTQQLIEQLLGVDFQLFCESTILGQDSLSFSTATDAEKKRILEHVADVAKFEDYLVVAQQRLQKVREQLQSLASEHALASQRHQSLYDERVRVLVAAESFEQRKQQDLAALEIELRGYADQAACIDRLEQEMLAYQDTESDAFRSARQSVQDATSALQESTDKVSTLCGTWSPLGAQRELLKTKLAAIVDTCPTCKRPFDSADREQARDTFREQIVGLTDTIGSLQIDLGTAERRKDNDESLLSQARAALIAQEAEKRRLDNEQLDRQAKFTAAQVAGASALRVQARIDSAKLQRNVDSDRAAKIEVGILQVAEAQLALDTQRTELLEQERYLEFWVKGFGKKGIRCFVLDGVANALNKFAAVYSQHLTDGEIEVVFSTQRKLVSGAMTDDFHVQGLNQHGADVYKGNSVGERQRVDMCVALALQDLIRSQTGSGTNLFVCDEAAANLDPEGAERMLSLLNEMAREGRSVFYVTHDLAMQDLFSRKLVVVKQGEVSRVEGADHD